MFKLTKLKFELDKAYSEIVGDFLSGIGAISVAEDFIDENRSEICAYFPESSDLSEIRYRIASYFNFLKEEYGDISYGKLFDENIDETSWQAWKDILKTVRVTDRILIKPPWEDYVPKDHEYLIEINPSMAFGTGHHESTRLCIRAAQELMIDNASKVVLDVGCGSGILSIAALMLGAESVTAIDTDPVSVDESHKNLKRNNVSHNIEVLCSTIDKIQGKFDLILANIYVEPLLAMKNEIKKRLKSDGNVVLSGFQEIRMNEISRGFKSAGFMIDREYKENDWIALVLKLQ